jgi:hypothetical protein
VAYVADLQKFQALEEEYRRSLTEYEREAAQYDELRRSAPGDPSLEERYRLVEEKGRQASAKYDELEALRRALRSSVVA